MSDTALTTLIEAAKNGDEGTVRDLLARDPGLASATLETGESPIIAALYRGHHHVIDALVDAGAFISGVLGRAPVSRAGKALLAKREKAQA